jgi:hypothetical protein
MGGDGRGPTAQHRKGAARWQGPFLPFVIPPHLSLFHSERPAVHRRQPRRDEIKALAAQ